MIVHKQCTGRLVDRCYPATQHKTKGPSANASASRLRTTSALNLNQNVASPLQAHASRPVVTTNYRTPSAAGYQSPTRGIEYRNPVIATSSGVAAPVRRSQAAVPSDTRSMGYDPTSKHIFSHMESVLSPSDLPSHMPPPIPGLFLIKRTFILLITFQNFYSSGKRYSTANA